MLRTSRRQTQRLLCSAHCFEAEKTCIPADSKIARQGVAATHLHAPTNGSEAYVKSLAGYLATGGRIAVVDFVPGKGGHAKDAEQQISKQQADAWMIAAGLKPVEDVAMFEDKWFGIYVK